MKKIHLKQINIEYLKGMTPLSLYDTHLSFLTENNTAYNLLDYRKFGPPTKESLEASCIFQYLEKEKIKLSSNINIKGLATPKSMLLNQDNSYIGFEMELPRFASFKEELLDEDFCVSLSDATNFFIKLNDTIEKGHKKHICFPSLFLNGVKNILYDKSSNELLLYDFPNFQIEEYPPISVLDSLPWMEQTIFSTTKYFDDDLFTENYDRFIILKTYLEFCTNQPLNLYPSFLDGDMMDVWLYLSAIGLDDCEILSNTFSQMLDFNSFDDIPNLTPILKQLKKEYSLIKRPLDISENPFQYEFIKKKELNYFVS